MGIDASESDSTRLNASSGAESESECECADPESIFPSREQYHQDYYKKKPILYKYYRFNCGRDQYLQYIWGDQAAAPKDPDEE